MSKLNHNEQLSIKEAIATKNHASSLDKTREHIATLLKTEIVLAMLVITEEMDKHLSHLSKEAKFSIHITTYQGFTGEAELDYEKYQNNNLAESDDAIINKLNILLQEVFFDEISQDQIERHFFNQELSISFNGNYSMDALEKQVITTFLGKDIYTLIHKANLEQSIQEKTNPTPKKHKI